MTKNKLREILDKVIGNLYFEVQIFFLNVLIRFIKASLYI
jgi:hypothetical protein